MNDNRFNRPVTVTVFDEDKCDGDWMPESLIDAIAWLQGMLDKVPPEYQSVASIDVDSGSYYDSQYTTISIAYERPPTEAEKQERAAEEKQNNEARLREARLQYERLKARFEQEAS